MFEDGRSPASIGPSSRTSRSSNALPCSSPESRVLHEGSVAPSGRTRCRSRVARTSTVVVIGALVWVMPSWRRHGRLIGGLYQCFGCLEPRNRVRILIVRHNDRSEEAQVVHNGTQGNLSTDTLEPCSPRPDDGRCDLWSSSQTFFLPPMHVCVLWLCDSVLCAVVVLVLRTPSLSLSRVARPWFGRPQNERLGVVRPWSCP